MRPPKGKRKIHPCFLSAFSVIIRVTDEQNFRSFYLREFYIQIQGFRVWLFLSNHFPGNDSIHF